MGSVGTLIGQLLYLSDCMLFLGRRVWGIPAAARQRVGPTLTKIAQLSSKSLQVLHALPDSSNLALLTFDGAVAAWHLNPALHREGGSLGTTAALPAADMFPGHAELSDARLGALMERLPRYAAPLSAGRPAAVAAVKSLR